MIKKIYFNWRSSYFKITIIFSFLFPSTVFSQTNSLSGIIHSSDGKVVRYADIGLNGSSNFHTFSDTLGKFSFGQSLPKGDYHLMVSIADKQLYDTAFTLENNKFVYLNLVLVNFTNQELNEVVITTKENGYVSQHASESIKLNMPLIEVPQNIAVINTKTFKDIGALSTDEILRTGSGILPSIAAGQDITLMIRGTTSHDNLFRNGIGLNYYSNQNPDVAMIDRIEFVKGPAGFTVSNADPSGFVNIVTKQPTHERILDANIGGGSWDMLRAAIDLGGEVKKGSAFTYRLNAGIQNQNQFYQFGYFRKYFVAGVLKYEMDKNTDISLEYNFAHGHSLNDPQYIPTVNGKFFVIPDNFNVSDPNSKGISSYDHYFKLNFNHNFNHNWSVRAYMGFMLGRWNSNGLYLATSQVPDVVSNDTIYRNKYKDNYKNNLVTAMACLKGKFNTGIHIQHDILASIDYGWTTAKEIYFSSDSLTPLYYPASQYYLPKDEMENFEGTAYPYQSRSRYYALYLQDAIKVYNKLIFTLATRYTLSGDQIGYSFPIPSGYQATNKLTPRFGLAYLFNNNVSAYIVNDQAFLPQVGKTFSGETLLPLTGNNKEVGVKSNWFNQKLVANISAYHTVKNNVLNNDPAHTGFMIQTGQIIAKGIELDIVGQVGKNLSILANYAYTDVRVSKSNDRAQIGLYNFNSPVHSTANLFVKYKVPKGSLKGLSLGTGLQYKSKFNSSPTENALLPGYTLLETSLGYVYKKYNFYLNVYNLTNKQYIAYASKYNALEWQYTPGVPLNFRVSLAYRL